MKKRWPIRLAIVVGVLVTLALLLIPRMTLLGFIRGESFYKGRPTSYWKEEIKHAIDANKPRPASYLDRLIRRNEAGFPQLGEPGALPVLAELLSDPDVEVRWHAAGALIDKGSWAEPVLPRLKELLRDDDPRVRRTAVYAVNSVETRIEVKIALFRGMLKDDDQMVRIIVAKLLGRIGAGSDEAVAALKEALDDEDEEVRVFATRALKKLRP
jgi:HEAT repeat protein